MDDVAVVGIPLLAILAGILFRRAHVKELRTELRGDIRGLRGEVKDARAEVKDVSRSERPASRGH